MLSDALRSLVSTRHIFFTFVTTLRINVYLTIACSIFARSTTNNMKTTRLYLLYDGNEIRLFSTLSRMADWLSGNDDEEMDGITLLKLITEKSAETSRTDYSWCRIPVDGLD